MKTNTTCSSTKKTITGFFNYIRIIVILSLIILPESIFAQTAASCTWAGTSNASSFNVGNVLGTNISFSGATFHSYDATGVRANN